MGSNLISRLDGSSNPHINDTLAACKYNTTPLHVFLMHTPWSPIDNSWIARFIGLYDIAISKQSVAAEATNMVGALGSPASSATHEAVELQQRHA